MCTEAQRQIMNDIDYFSESKMNSRNMEKFYEELPEHLQSKFNSAWENRNFIDGDYFNVLQGYRGPANLCNGDSGDSATLESSYGVQEVKFWWGVSKRLLVVPIFGWGDFAFGRLLQNTNWHSVYFDEATGKVVSYAEAQEIKQKNREADSYNKQGNKLFKQGKYKEAFEKFKESCKRCSERYSEKSQFESNMNNAGNKWAEELNKQGIALAKQNRNEEALVKYTEAADLTTEFADKSIYFDNQALMLLRIGDALQNAGNNEQAMSMYDEALSKATNDNTINSIKDSKATAIRNQEADNHDKHGNELFNQEKYKEAFEEFKNAYKKCSSRYSEENRFKSNMNNAGNKWAEELNKQGIALAEQNRNEEALAKYTEAADLTTEFADKSIYFDNQALMLLRIGDALQNAGNNEQAISMYDEALSKATNDNTIDSIKDSQATAICNQEADNHDKQGNELFSQGKYKEAFEEFKNAYNKCSSRYSEENQFKSNMNNAGNKWAEELNKQGIALAEQNRNEEALAKYTEAADLTTEFADKSIYFDNQALMLLRIGDALQNAGNNEQAMRKYDEALSKATNDNTIDSIKNSQASAICNQGDELFNQGKLKEAEEKFELAIGKYEEAASKFNCAAKVKVLNVIFNSFIKVIDAMIKNGAYDEAKISIDYAKNHFPTKSTAFQAAEQMINDKKWSRDYLKQHLVQQDQQLSGDNIVMGIDYTVQH